MATIRTQVDQIVSSLVDFKLLKLLSQGAALRLTVAIFASVLSGVADLGVTICLLESFRTGAVLWWQFTIVALFSLLAGRYSRAALARLTTRSIVRMRRRLVRSLLHAPLQNIERIGPTRLLVAFTSDLANVASAVRNLASLCASMGILFACLVYIGWFAPAIMVVTTSLCLVCVGGAFVLRRLEQQHHHATREAWDRVVEILGMMLAGVKQLKLNRQLASQVLLSFEHRVREQQESGGARRRYSDLVATWIPLLFYVILGVAVFGPFQARMNLEFGLLALLQIRRPLRSLIVDSNAFGEASVALRRITEIGLSLSEDHRTRDSEQPPSPSPRSWNRLELSDVVFSYGNGDESRDDGFVLGPMEMTLKPGELIIVAGANDSGKTTLAKVLTGLYPPTRGTIRFDRVRLDERNGHWYRRKFAVVFADFCLFDGVEEVQIGELRGEGEQLAVRLKLNRWMLAGRESSDKSAPFSSRERKRIALLRAVLEDRPVLVFDEWAADQDLQIKEFFYREFLPTMRNSGKLVVAISDDERYFRVADRVLWLERGKGPTWRSPASFPGAEAVTTVNP